MYDQWLLVRMLVIQSQDKKTASFIIDKWCCHAAALNTDWRLCCRQDGRPTSIALP